MKFISLLLFFSLVFVLSHAQAQKHGTSKKKSQYKGDIEYSQKLLPKKGKATTNKLKIIKRQISKRNSLIREIKDEIAGLDEQIFLNQDTIDTYQLNLRMLAKEYEKMVLIAYKNKSDYDRMMFIFAANSFNQAYKRLRILKYYSEYRQQQAKSIQEQKEKLQDKIKLLSASKDEKMRLLESYHVETSDLQTQISEQTRLLDDLNQNESQVKEEVEHNNAVNSEINTIVKDAVSKSGNSLTSVTKIQKGGLGNNKGKLPWPVKHGIVLSYFGEQSHPFLKGVKVKNDGIEISTLQGAAAYVVFDGLVKKVVAIPGANNAVLVAHGDFYTLYSNLTQVKVKVGDHVKIGQEIGSIYTNTTDNNLTILHFQVWHSDKKLNPMTWLKRDKIN